MKQSNKTFIFLLIAFVMVVLAPQVVSAEESDDQAAPNHPYLLADEQRLADLREKLNAEAFQDYRRALLNAAKREGSPGHLAPWLYRLTGQRTYLEQALAWMEEEAPKTNHARFRMMAAMTMAIAYDLLYDELPDTLRRQVEAYLDRVVDHYLEATKKGGWFVNDWGSSRAKDGATGWARPITYGGPARRSARTVFFEQEAQQWIFPSVISWMNKHAMTSW